MTDLPGLAAARQALGLRLGTVEQYLLPDDVSLLDTQPELLTEEDVPLAPRGVYLRDYSGRSGDVRRLQPGMALHMDAAFTVSIDEALPTNPTSTFCAMVRCSDVTGDESTLFCRWRDAGDESWRIRRLSAEAVAIDVHDGTITERIVAPVPSWSAAQLVGFTFAAGLVSVVRNGVVVRSVQTSLAAVNAAAGSALSLGSEEDFAGTHQNHCGGKLWDAMLFLRVPTAAELLQISRAHGSVPVAPDHHYRCMEGIGNVLLDYGLARAEDASKERRMLIFADPDKFIFRDGLSYEDETGYVVSTASPLLRTRPSGATELEFGAHVGKHPTTGDSIVFVGSAPAPLDYEGQAPRVAQAIDIPMVTLDNTNQYLSFPDALRDVFSTATSFAVEFYVTFTATDAFKLMLFCRASATDMWMVRSNGSSLRFGVVNTTGTFARSIAVATNVEYRVRASWNHETETAELWLDDAPSTGTAAPDAVSTDAMRFGGTTGVGAHVHSLTLWSDWLGEFDVNTLDRFITEMAYEQFPLQEGAGDTVYGTIRGSVGTIVNGDANIWGTLQATRAYAMQHGYRLSSGVQIPARLDGVAAADGEPITHPRGGLNGDVATISLDPWDSWLHAIPGGWAVFDGSSWVQLHDLYGLQETEIEVDVWLDAIAGVQPILGSPGEARVEVDANGNLVLRDESGNSFAFASGLQAGRWHHLKLIRRSSAALLVRDQTLISPGTAAITGSLRFDRVGVHGAGFFAGRMRRLRLVASPIDSQYPLVRDVLDVGAGAVRHGRPMGIQFAAHALSEHSYGVAATPPLHIDASPTSYERRLVILGADP